MGAIFNVSDHRFGRPAIGTAAAAAVVVLLGASAVVWLLGSTNPYTPAGYVGYLTKGAVFGKSRYYGVQRGPTSPGRRWLVEVTNISITPYTLYIPVGLMGVPLTGTFSTTSPQNLMPKPER